MWHDGILPAILGCQSPRHLLHILPYSNMCFSTATSITVPLPQVLWLLSASSDDRSTAVGLEAGRRWVGTTLNCISELSTCSSGSDTCLDLDPKCDRLPASCPPGIEHKVALIPGSSWAGGGGRNKLLQRPCLHGVALPGRNGCCSPVWNWEGGEGGERRGRREERGMFPL